MSCNLRLKIFYQIMKEDLCVSLAVVFFTLTQLLKICAIRTLLFMGLLFMDGDSLACANRQLRRLVRQIARRFVGDDQTVYSFMRLLPVDLYSLCKLRHNCRQLV